MSRSQHFINVTGTIAPWDRPFARTKQVSNSFAGSMVMAGYCHSCWYTIDIQRGSAWLCSKPLSYHVITSSKHAARVPSYILVNIVYRGQCWNVKNGSPFIIYFVRSFTPSRRHFVNGYDYAGLSRAGRVDLVDMSSGPSVLIDVDDRFWIFNIDGSSFESWMIANEDETIEDDLEGRAGSSSGWSSARQGLLTELWPDQFLPTKKNFTTTRPCHRGIHIQFEAK